MEEGLFHNPTFVDYINEFAVAVIGHSGQHAEIERQNPKTGAVEQVCPHYDTIPCSVHNTCSTQARPNFDFRGVPATFVCDPTGKILTKDVPRNPQGTIDALTKAQQTIGAKLRSGKFKDALKAYQKVLGKDDIPEFILARARQRVEDLQARALEAIAEAQALDAKKAKKQLKKLIKEFKDLEDAKAAAEAALAELEGGE
jgi:hypothetical protein